MLVTSSAVARSLDFAAAMSSGEGISGDAGTVTAAARADGVVSLRREREGSKKDDGGAQHGRLAAGTGQTHSQPRRSLGPG